ncbi:MAG: Crp/Fnr family transcriptional regulator [Elusimicrobiota bacterium]|nr:Crp/Fnr family transcriptional regulator [Elusimicrobiota bacterium]
MPIDKNYISILKNLPFFSDLTDNQFKRLLTFSSIENFKKGRVILKENDPASSMYVILEGTLKVYHLYGNDKVTTLAYLKKGDVLGEMAILSPFPRSASARAVTDVKLIKIKGTGFRTLLKKDRKLSQKIIQILCRRLKAANEKIQTFTSRDVYHRLIKALLNLADLSKESGGKKEEAVIKITQQELADIAGTTREEVSRKLNRMAGEKILKPGRGKIKILDFAKLKELSGKKI